MPCTKPAGKRHQHTQQTLKYVWSLSCESLAASPVGESKPQGQASNHGWRGPQVGRDQEGGHESDAADTAQQDLALGEGEVVVGDELACRRKGWGRGMSKVQLDQKHSP